MYTLQPKKNLILNILDILRRYTDEHLQSIEKGWYRIIDDSGEDYLYPPENLEIIEQETAPMLEKYDGKRVRIVTTNGKLYEGVVGDYVYP